MNAAADLLTDLGASFEYPGWISIPHPAGNMAFGDMNGDYTYNRADCEPMSREVEPLAKGATVEELAAWIRKVMAEIEGAA